jgi:sulfite reductase (NADPH) flavoprotein alpha-component
MAVASRTVLETAQAHNREVGHENLGFLTESHGNIPSSPPLLALSPSHRAWDEIGAQLPRLFKSVTLRRAFDDLPVLSAAPDDLPDTELLRASTLLGMFAHSYHRVQQLPADSLPPSIQRPWDQVSARLDRSAPHLSYVDLITYNWRLLDPDRPDPMRIENLELLVPSVDNQEERVFYLVQVEIAAQTAPVVAAAVRAQEAAERDDPEALTREFAFIADTLQRVARESFLKIRPDPYAPSFVDSVVWAKTVAPFAVPVNPGVPGPSGTNAMLFHVMDALLGRTRYASRFGVEVEHLSGTFPVFWRQFLAALRDVSVRDYVANRGDRELGGIFTELLEAYSGERGFLMRHRLKVHGFLDIAFKAGRSVTITGFEGKFKDRTWEEVDSELGASIDERRLDSPSPIRHAQVTSVVPVHVEGDNWVKQVTLGVAGTGVRYQPGDRVAILPENSRELVDATLSALRAGGDEQVQLSRLWREAVQSRDGTASPTHLPLRSLLAMGRIRPVERDVAKTLLRLSGDEALRDIVEARAEDQWELWDLLELLTRRGFDPRTLWRAQPGEREHICRLIPPEKARMYSISSTMGDGQTATELSLTIGGLRYKSADAPRSEGAARRGTASNYLGDPDSWIEEVGTPLAFTVVRPPRFALPADGSEPVVMFAGGTGIAPFRGFLQERARRGDDGESWLFLGTRTTADLYYRSELETAVSSGRLNLRVAFSRDPLTARTVSEDDGFRLVLEPGETRHIGAEMLACAEELWDLLRPRSEGGRGGRFYICGRTGFARAVFDGLKEIGRQVGGLDEAGARHLLGLLTAEGRLMLDVFTTYPGPHALQPARYDASEVVLHNDDELGWWMVVDGRVYDVGEFLEMHPGGKNIVQAYGGVDATRAYRAVRHHIEPEVDAQRGIYEIGTIRRLDFGAEWGVAIGPNGLHHVPLAELYKAWARFLYAIVEMSNALRLDYTIHQPPLTRRDEPGEMTPYRLGFLMEAHDRFVLSYLGFTTGEDLQDLWALTSGLCASSERVTGISDEIARVQASEAASAVVRASAHGPQALSLVGPAAGVAVMGAVVRWVGALEEENKRYLQELKGIVRDGLLVFEELGPDAVRVGGGRLLMGLHAIPRLLESYYARLEPHARAVEGLLEPIVV